MKKAIILVTFFDSDTVGGALYEVDGTASLFFLKNDRISILIKGILRMNSTCEHKNLEFEFWISKRPTKTVNVVIIFVCSFNFINVLLHIFFYIT